MVEEIKSLESNQTWELVERPKNNNWYHVNGFSKRRKGYLEQNQQGLRSGWLQKDSFKKRGLTTMKYSHQWSNTPQSK